MYRRNKDKQSIFFNPLGGPPKNVPKKPVSEARVEAQERSARILANQAELSAIVDRHEAMVQKRWTKKTNQQRLNILLEAWPYMPPSHRPDFYALRRESSVRRETKARLRAHFMWPYINQEDLLQPKNLLYLLNARSRHHPSKFAMRDNDTWRLGAISHNVVPVIVENHVMTLNDVENDQQYGELRLFRDSDQAREWSESHNQFHPGEGLIVLEAQDRLMMFLLACVRDILCHIAPEKLTSAEFPVQPEPVIKSELESRGFTSLASMVVESQYRLPAKFNLEGITSVLKAALADAKDHLLSLRQDPAYFEEQIIEAREHCQEVIKDEAGRVDPNVKDGFQDVAYLLVVTDFLREAFLRIEIFAELLQQAQNLQLWQAKHLPDISPTTTLPYEFVVALLKFNHYTRQALKHMLNEFKIRAPASPPLRKFFVRKTVDKERSDSEESETEGSETEGPKTKRSKGEVIVLKSHMNTTKIESQLLWLVRIISENSNELSEISHPLVLDELERLIESESEAQELVSAKVAEHLGVLSILTESLNMLHFNRNINRLFEEVPKEEVDKIMAGFELWAEPLSSGKISFEHEKVGVWSQLADPAGGRFYYPVEKRRTEENVALLRNAETHLDIFWSAMEPLMEDGKGKAIEYYRSIQDDIEGTPEWDDKSPATFKDTEPVPNGTSIENLSVGPLSDEPGGDEGSISKVQFAVRPRRYKAKTQGASQETASILSEANVEIPGQRRPESAIKGSSAESLPLGTFDNLVDDSSSASKVDLNVQPRRNKVKTRGLPQETTSDSPETNAETLVAQEKVALPARALKVFRTIFFNPEVTSTPGELSWIDFLYAMGTMGFSAQKRYGSAWQFQSREGPAQDTIYFHEPHPSGNIGFHLARFYGRRLTRKLGWTGYMFKAKK